MQTDKRLTVGDGFRLGLGFLAAQVVVAIGLLVLWAAGCGALITAVETLP